MLDVAGATRRKTLGWAQVARLDSTYVDGKRLRHDGRIDHPGPHGVLPWCRDEMGCLREIDGGRGTPLALPVARGIAGPGCGRDVDRLRGLAADRHGVSASTVGGCFVAWR